MRCTTLALAICLPTAALAQAPAATAPPFEAVTGSFFAISVPDLQASTRYTEKLGLKSILSVPKQPGAVGVNVLRARGVTIFMGPFRPSNQPPNVIVRDTSGTLIQFIGR